MKQSEQIEQLNAALAEAAKKFPVIQRGRTAKVKTKTGGEYSYDYADLDDVLSAIRLPLAEQGLTLTHDCVVTREPLGVETVAILNHASGQFRESSPLWLPCDDFMAPTQAIGSASTYGKRYTGQGILGLSTESDDDANGASGNDASTSKKEPLPACPKCDKGSSAVIPGKAEYGAGLLCFGKKGGCGHSWETPEHPFNEKHRGKSGDKPAEPLKTEAEPEGDESTRFWKVANANKWDKAKAAEAFRAAGNKADEAIKRMSA